jgi:hypothetical protein
MLLPMHTNGCMGSMEGLFFESSATVPYHFLNQAQLSETPSSAMRDLPYGSLDVADGVTKLQLLGVKYYLAVSAKSQQEASLDPRLTLRASVPAAAGKEGETRTWNAYEIADSDIVAGLVNQPVVMSDPGSISTRRNPKADTSGKLSSREAWLENSLAWYTDPAKRDVALAADGPSTWQRVQNAEAFAPVTPVADPARVSLIGTSDDRISFRVENPGSPVVVRASYFPNWKVSGAKGPYRLTPNLMVVIPTKNDVTLHYGHTPVDVIGVLMTLAGLVGVALLFRVDRRVGDLTPERRTGERRGDAEHHPHLMKVESSRDGTAAEVLEIHSPPEEPKTS